MGARIHETCCVCAKGLLTESLESVRGWHGFAIELGEMFNLLKRLQVPVPVYDASPDVLWVLWKLCRINNHRICPLSRWRSWVAYGVSCILVQVIQKRVVKQNPLVPTGIVSPAEATEVATNKPRSLRAPLLAIAASLLHRNIAYCCTSYVRISSHSASTLYVPRFQSIP